LLKPRHILLCPCCFYPIVLDTTKDYKSKETVKGAIGIVTPLLLNKIGVPKPVSKNLVDGVLLGDKLNGK
jgi:hypothetical protein